MFQMLFERSADAIFLFDPRLGVFVDCNQAAVRMMRASSKDQLLMMNPADLSPEFQPDGRSSREKSPEMTELAIANGSHRFEWNALRFDGTEFPMEVLATPIQSGDHPLFATVCRDITERKRAEREVLALNASLEQRVEQRTAELVRANEQLRRAQEEMKIHSERLRESEARFGTAFHASPVLTTISRLNDATMIEVNDAFVKWMGLARDKILFRNTFELGLWRDQEERSQFIARLRTAGCLRDFESQFRSQRGTTHTLLLTAGIIEINREPHLLAFGLDITQRKRAEAEMLKTLEREKELAQLRGKFVSMVSHEFRTPLGIIGSSAEILDGYLDRLGPAERQEHLQSIQKNTRLMAGLMEEVLLLGQLDAGKMDFNPVPLDLGAFMRGLVDEVMSATNRRCPVELHFGEIPAKAKADERLLRHIFTNLLTNAIKYSEAGTSVRLEVCCDGAEIVSIIRDHGIGIPEADQEWLFNAFYRAGNVGNRPGSGLGLVIVKQCVDLLGGRIQLQSKPGEGTIATVRLPQTLK